MFAEVEQRGLDAEFDETYPENGSFSKRERNGQEYWYYNGYDRQTGGKYVKYVGPAREADISRRVERFSRIKADFRDRRRMVVALKAAGLPAPDPLVGDVVDALWRAALIRGRSILPPESRTVLRDAIKQAAQDAGDRPGDIGFAD